MFALYDLDTAMNEYEQKLRTAEEGRQASKFEQRYARKLARQVARLAGLLLTALGLKYARILHRVGAGVGA